jgi:hypothetical protein
VKGLGEKGSQGREREDSREGGYHQKHHICLYGNASEKLINMPLISMKTKKSMLQLPESSVLSHSPFQKGPGARNPGTGQGTERHFPLISIEALEMASSELLLCPQQVPGEEGSVNTYCVNFHGTKSV